MKTKTAAATTLIVVIMLLTQANAQPISQAESYYVSARNHLNNEDYKNALRDANLARLIYVDLDNKDAISQCDKLIDEISAEITDSMKASYYYSIAQDYFFEGNRNPSIETYDKAKYFAQLSKETYAKIGDAQGERKAEDIITWADGELDAYFSKARRAAEEYYNLAKTAFREEEYLTAIAYAENASGIYSAIPDANGIEKTKILADSIREEINQVRENAESVYDTAKELYNQGNLTGSELLANKAKFLYASISYAPGVQRANDLLTLIHEFTHRQDEQMKVTAAKLVDAAEELFIRDDYVNSTETVKQARDIYYELYTNAEGDLRTQDYYLGFIKDCNQLLQRISDEWGREKKLEAAEQFFEQSQQYYLEQQFDEALSYAEKAKGLFSDLDYYVGVGKSESLISTIGDRVAKERNADGNLSLARQYMAEANFESALVHAEQAKRVYDTLIGSNKSFYANEVIGGINEGVARKEEALRLYNLAYDQFNSGNFDMSERTVQQAYDIYVGLNYSIGIKESKSLLDKSSGKVSEEKLRQRTLILFFLVVVIVAAILAINYLKKKREVDEAARIAEEERKKRVEREKKRWQVEKEIEAKKMAEDKLKEMISGERDAIGEDAASGDEDIEEELI